MLKAKPDHCSYRETADIGRENQVQGSVTIGSRGEHPEGLHTDASWEMAADSRR